VLGVIYYVRISTFSVVSGLKVTRTATT